MFEHMGVGLRVIEQEDLDFLRELRNDPETWSFLGSPFLLTSRNQQDWFDYLQASKDKLYFVFYNQVSVHRLGLIRMDEYDPLHRSIRVGGDIHPQYRGAGEGTRMYQLIFRYCFYVLNIHRVWLLVLRSNSRARSLYTKMGFKEEGVQREAIFRNGRYDDYIMMSILEPEYTKDEVCRIVNE